MKKLLALALSVMLLLSVAVCAQGMETTGAAAPSPAQAPREGLNKDIYVDREWSILNAKHDREVTITMWIPNSATSTMGTAIQALADRFNAEQLEKYPGKNITVVVEFQNKSGTLNEKLPSWRATTRSSPPSACPPSRSTRPGRWICVRCSPMRSCSSSPRA